MPSAWCSRCGRYDIWGSGCKCTLLGRVWFPDSGETEADACDLWGLPGGIDDAIEAWLRRRDYSNADYPEGDRAICFRLDGDTEPGSRTVQIFNVTTELEMTYRAREVDGGRGRAETRRRMANNLRDDRRWRQKKKAMESSR